MNKHLYLMRHAQAETSSPMSKDFDRMLTSTGMSEATKMGERLSQLQVKPTLILTSSADRCARTAELLAERLGFDTDAVVQESELYEASVRSLLAAINGIDESHSSVLLVGHNPAATYLAEYLTRSEIGSMPTGGVVHIELQGQKWAEVTGQSGQLIWFEYPEKISEGEA
jgi:phosphohistidine phosphatase